MLTDRLEIISNYVEAERSFPGSGARWLLYILHFPEFAVPHPEIAKLYAEFYQRRKGGEEIGLMELLKESIRRSPRDLFDPGIHPALAATGTALEELGRISAPSKDSSAGNSTFVPEPNEIQNNSYRAWLLKHTRITTDRRFIRPDHELLQMLVRPFVMNVSALNNFLACPLQFYFATLLRVDAGDPAPARFGSAIHHALQRLFEKMKIESYERFPPKEEFIADFESYLFLHRKDFTASEFARRLQYGSEVLAGYYENNIKTWNKIVLIETSIRHVSIAGVPVKGMIDKLEFNGAEVKIVDYKSGNHAYALKQLQPPSEELPNGGNYWRQAVFYTLLVENRPGKKWNPSAVEFNFIEPDADGSYLNPLLKIASQDKTTVTHQIIDSWEKIRQYRFFEGCNKPGCRWCSLINPDLSDL
jgi:hypothetical protein